MLKGKDPSDASARWCERITMAYLEQFLNAWEDYFQTSDQERFFSVVREQWKGLSPSEELKARDVVSFLLGLNDQYLPLVAIGYFKLESAVLAHQVESLLEETEKPNESLSQWAKGVHLWITDPEVKRQAEWLLLVQRAAFRALEDHVLECDASGAEYVDVEGWERLCPELWDYLGVNWNNLWEAVDALLESLDVDYEEPPPDEVDVFIEDAMHAGREMYPELFEDYPIQPKDLN